jgi:putative phosphoesterase
MRIGIISDTHDNHRGVRKAIEIFNEQAVEYVLHAGDMTGPSTASLFAELRGSRFVAVMGNCDADRVSLKGAIQTFGGDVYESGFDGEIDGKAVYMAHIPHSVKHAADSQAYDLVVYGHTHHQDIHRVGKTLIVNPGAARNWMAEGGHVAIVDLSDMSITSESL